MKFDDAYGIFHKAYWKHTHWTREKRTRYALQQVLTAMKEKSSSLQEPIKIFDEVLGRKLIRDPRPYTYHHTVLTVKPIPPDPWVNPWHTGKEKES